MQSRVWLRPEELAPIKHSVRSDQAYGSDSPKQVRQRRLETLSHPLDVLSSETFLVPRSMPE